MIRCRSVSGLYSGFFQYHGLGLEEVRKILQYVSDDVATYIKLRLFVGENNESIIFTSQEEKAI